MICECGVSGSRWRRAALFENSVGDFTYAILERDARALCSLPEFESAFLRILRREESAHLNVRKYSPEIHATDATSFGKFDGNVSVAHQYDALIMLPFGIYLPHEKIKDVH
jgi:hypothetical protein